MPSEMLILDINLYDITPHQVLGELDFLSSWKDMDEPQKQFACSFQLALEAQQLG